MLNYKKKKLIALILCISLTSVAAKCGDSSEQNANKPEEPLRTKIIKLEDDFSTSLESVARIITQAKAIGALQQNDIDVIKPILQEVSEANGKAIELLSNFDGTIELPKDTQDKLLAIINGASAALTKLNNEGLLRIKDQTKRAAFNALVLSMQGLAGTFVTLLVPKKGE